SSSGNAPKWNVEAVGGPGQGCGCRSEALALSAACAILGPNRLHAGTCKPLGKWNAHKHRVADWETGHFHPRTLTTHVTSTRFAGLASTPTLSVLIPPSLPLF